jgi:hypothetical protein
LGVGLAVIAEISDGKYGIAVFQAGSAALVQSLRLFFDSSEIGLKSLKLHRINLSPQEAELGAFIY